MIKGNEVEIKDPINWTAQRNPLQFFFRCCHRNPSEWHHTELRPNKRFFVVVRSAVVLRFFFSALLSLVFDLQRPCYVRFDKFELFAFTSLASPYIRSVFFFFLADLSNKWHQTVDERLQEIKLKKRKTQMSAQRFHSI